MATRKELQEQKVRGLIYGNESQTGLLNDFGIPYTKFEECVELVLPNIKAELKYPDRFSKHHTQWRKIFVNYTGKRNDHDWWVDMEKIANAVREYLQNRSIPSREKLSSLHNRIKSKLVSPKPKIKFGYFPNQDTILPYFFKNSYNRNLDVQFVRFENWSDGLSAFRDKKVDVALRDFATAVAFNSQIGTEQPLFFYPLFSFNGYFIFVKKKKLHEVAKKHKATNKHFHQLPLEAKQELFESKDFGIILERQTDFEWAVLNFCQSLDCNLEKVRANIKHCNTIAAKDEYLSKDKYVIHCTNPINSSVLIKNKSLVPITQSNSVNEHHNFNGILCTIDFLNNHEDSVAQVIATWFNDVVQLKRDLSKGTNIIQDHNELLLPGLADFLRREIPADIQTKDLLTLLGSGHNTFFDTPDEAFDKFYKDVLHEDNVMLKNYQEISLVQLGQEDQREKVTRVINLIKDYMSRL